MSRTYVPESLHHARRLIDYGCEAPLDVRRLAAEAGLSPYHFIRQFRRAFRHTPHQYLVRRRIESAKEMLRGGTSVTEACFAVGFHSFGAFTEHLQCAYGAAADHLSGLHGRRGRQRACARVLIRSAAVQARICAYLNV